MPRKSQRVSFSGGSGFELAGIFDAPEDLSSAPSVVFSHCFTCNKDLKAIVRISRALAERGIGVLRFDMTGLGDSQGDFSRTNFSTNLADLRAAVRFANSELAAVTALMGHSFGGAASLALAGLNEVSGLGAVVSLAAPSDTKHLAELLERMNPEIVRVGRGEVSIGGRAWPIQSEMLVDFRRHALPDLISQIRVPTLILHSPIDETLPFDHALRILGLIHGGNHETPASLFSMADADHLLSRDPADLELVAEVVAAFLLRYASAG